ncbi:MAG: hypothetical protein K2O71_00970, partial [Lachnospiraceae bacterium]|nr:hypothetical protein [Lachnospiraceae bacterium]
MKEKRKLVLSILGLLSGASIYKVFTVLAVMGFSEIALFFYCAQKDTERLLENALYNRQIYPIFFLALGLVFFLLMRTEGMMGEKGGATMRRLRLSGIQIFLVETCYNLVCILLVFAVQIWILIVALKIISGGSSEEFFLAFYRVEFLHSLLPLAEGRKWIKNLLLVLAFSVGAASGFGERESILFTVIFPLTLVWFVRQKWRM